MKGVDFVTALGRLLSDPVLREQFAREPEVVIEQLHVAEADRRALLAINAEDLQRQADGLLNKRWRAVADLLPETVAALGDRAVDLFRFYATRQWPRGHRRHLLDAAAFAEFLKANRLGLPKQADLQRLRSIRRECYESEV